MSIIRLDAGDDGGGFQDFFGDGPSVAGMSPPPAHLRWVIRRSMAEDGYLIWAITDVGAGVGLTRRGVSTRLAFFLWAVR